VNAERDHWLHITDDPNWERNHIHDPNIPLDETLKAVTDPFPPDPQRILEIGCGTGRLTKRIAATYPDAIVVGIDINHKTLPKSSLRSFYLCRDNLTGFAGFDAIYSVTVFQHLPHDEQQAYIEQAYEALNSYGVLRVQFIEGDGPGDLCDHKTPPHTMLKWFIDAGFLTDPPQVGLAHPQWSWITGTK
jgi:cyclopropane fatty-acyl-phospholipid synthase-like methyltransferase